MMPGFGHFFEDMSSILAQMQVVQSAEGGGVRGANVRLATDPGHASPVLLLRGRIQNLLSMRDNELMYENDTGGATLRLPGSIGDYFLGPGLDQLIQQLAENDPNRHGTPPASKSAIKALPTIFISEEHKGTDAAQCAVCKDEFELCTEVKQMPCKHLYHSNCILPWLEQHNSCPVCRYELPTDDPDYEQSCARGPMRASSSGTIESRGSEGASNRQVGGLLSRSIPRDFLVGSPPVESNNSLQQEQPSPSQDNNRGREGAQGTGRRFSISFPWFRGFTGATSYQTNTSSGEMSQTGREQSVPSGSTAAIDDTSEQDFVGTMDATSHDTNTPSGG
ncbi:hypothetical protein KP509_27G002200 [Ceratopteris richardii]|nr:hypothetical protein KP509_27G002200 [Ceratopteris richardii]